MYHTAGGFDAPATPGRILVVDLDGTLLRSDMLLESLWSALGSDWRVPVRCATALLRGRAELKRQLAARAPLDVALLPYNAEVLAYVENWRRVGGRTALVTATDQGLAERVAERLGIFDEVHGSDGHRNLKGRSKPVFLAERFGTGGYTYMADAVADLPVWQGAGKAITVGATSRLRARVEALGVEREHIAPGATAFRPYLRALRPHQWVKNLLVFAPLLAGHRLSPDSIALSALAFVAFSLVASGVYIVNDLLDLAADRVHPRKRGRPFASGEVPLLHGSVMALGLFAAGFLLALAAGLAFAGVMFVYLAVTTAYSVHLKRLMLIDIAVLAGLYTIRLIAGAAATGIELSFWLLAFSLFLFFALAAVKRQAEIVDASRGGRPVTLGRGYRVEDLPVVTMMALASGYVAVLVMALYLNSPEVLVLYTYPPALWGICCVLLYWVSRMVMVTHRGCMDDDPIVFAARDRVSQGCLLAILFLTVAGAVL